jgi:hypothetical protein
MRDRSRSISSDFKNKSRSFLNDSYSPFPSAVPSFLPALGPRPRARSHLFSPRSVPIPILGSRINNKSTMTVVIDLISISSDEDDHSLSSVDSYYDCFKLGIDEHGTLFVRDKVSIVLTIDVDEDDVTTNSMTSRSTTFDSILESDSSYCSTLCLSDDTWYREKALGPSKKRQDLFARRYVSCCGVSCSLLPPSSSSAASSSSVEAIFFESSPRQIFLYVYPYGGSVQRSNYGVKKDILNPRTLYARMVEYTRFGA